MGFAAIKYQPHAPEKTVLYSVVKNQLEAFRQELSARHKELPQYVEDEFAAFLECGVLEHGFARLKCVDCGHEKLLAFSCKRRGFCPSCCGRRMNETEKRVVEEVFPRQPARQWVLSLPMPVRFLCARNRRLINDLVKVFYDTINRLIGRKLRRLGMKKAQGGGVLFIQRLGGALNANVHFHAIFLDGGYTYDTKTEGFVFHEIEDDLTAEDVAWAVEKIAMRSFAVLEKHGFLVDGEGTGGDEPNALDLCDDASVKNQIAFGERAGQAVRRIRLRIDDASPKIIGDLTAQMNWFNLKADSRVKAHQRWKLARLVRYVSRPPLAHERLSVADDGTLRYTMKKPWSDGTVEIVLSGVELIEKLAAAIPPPRGHLIRYFGALAPNAAIRNHIVIVPKPKARDDSGKIQLSATQRTSWAELAKQAFGLDLTKCEKCGGSVRRVAVIRDPAVIKKILVHLGLMGRPEHQPPPMAVARPPPAGSVTYEPIYDDPTFALHD